MVVEKKTEAIVDHVSEFVVPEKSESAKRRRQPKSTRNTRRMQKAHLTSGSSSCTRR